MKWTDPTRWFRIQVGNFENQAKCGVVLFLLNVQMILTKKGLYIHVLIRITLYLKTSGK